ncbi:OLC1v1025550C2 [Oldenlandia corymbosa var. corymbosa]|uniref:OLC1v1025550C2 n=1 Tax=Oldenlandia corymbosa var. corymbosa TaxID=529605 RepID=A0AAV1C6I7_OLDCO|nr:OLC1v1025550C2 [Oldenlandia corymbosa var. corymbosa]
MGSIQLLHSPIVSLSSSPKTLYSQFSNDYNKVSSFFSIHYRNECECNQIDRWRCVRSNNRRRMGRAVLVSNKEDTEVSSSSATSSSSVSTSPAEDKGQAEEADPEALEYISQIKRVLELLKTNRDMTFNEVKLTIMIEDPRDVERKRLLGIDDETAPTRDDLAAALEEVNEGKIPEDRLALQLLAEELNAWPNLEVELPKKKAPGRSLYAKATDTGVNPKEAAKRLNIDWDAAAEFEEEEDSEDVDVPPAVV